MPENDNRNCDCMMPGSKSKNAEMYSHLQHLEPAMAYVPCQKFTGIFELPYALSVGTVFPQLCNAVLRKERWTQMNRTVPDASSLVRSMK